MKLALALAAVCAFPLVPADTLAFGPEKGTKLEKRFSLAMNLEKKSMSMSVAGQELPAELLEDTTMNLSSKQEVVVEDEYRELGDDRPLVLARKYAELSEVHEQKVLMLGMEEAQEETDTKKSALEEETVLFRWNEKESRYDKEWVGDGADDALLEGLEEDMDMRNLLPGKSLTKGDTWTVDLKEFGEILGPGGDLGLKSEKDEDDEDDDNDFEENLTGEVVCTYAGEQEVGGKKLARVQVVCKGKTFQDEEQDEGQTMHMSFDIELEGEFLWDAQAKHLASYKLAGEVTSDMEIKQQVEMGGETGELVVKIGLAGEMALEGEVTAK